MLKTGQNWGKIANYPPQCSTKICTTAFVGNLPRAMQCRFSETLLIARSGFDSRPGCVVVPLDEALCEYYVRWLCPAAGLTEKEIETKSKQNKTKKSKKSENLKYSHLLIGCGFASRFRYKRIESQSVVINNISS